MKKLIATLIIATAVFNTANAQLKMPIPSPNATITQGLGISKIEVTYSRPGIKGRKIFGDLVEYNKLWRTGANSPTRFKIDHEINFGGKMLAAGEYSIFSIPNEKQWEIIVNKDPEKKNVFEYNQADDVIRVQIPVQQTATKTETFTILFTDISDTTCNFQLMWENTLVSIPLKITYKAEVMKQISEVMGKDSRPYYTAANYYLENGGDVNQALEWYKKAVEMNPKAYWVLLGQAKAELKLGKKENAIQTAEKAVVLAKADNDPAYVKLIEAVIAEAKK
jgi:tetratricopeptide (TPR) repeat protein